MAAPREDSLVRMSHAASGYASRSGARRSQCDARRQIATWQPAGATVTIPGTLLHNDSLNTLRQARDTANVRELSSVNLEANDPGLRIENVKEPSVCRQRVVYRRRGATSKDTGNVLEQLHVSFLVDLVGG